MNSNHSMRDMVDTIVRKLVDNPEEVKVTEIYGDRTTVLEVKVKKEDIGKIIGRKGKTATSLRNIIQAIGAKQNRRIVMEIVE